MTQVILSFFRRTLFLLFFVRDLYNPALAAELQHRYARLPNTENTTGLEICESTRQKLVKGFKKSYQLEDTLGSCQPFVDAGTWAVVFSFEKPSSGDVPEDFIINLVWSTEPYVVTEYVDATQVRTKILWNGTGWEEQQRRFVIKVPTTREVSFSFANLEECNLRANEILTGALGLLPIAASCFQDSQQKLAIALMWKAEDIAFVAPSGPNEKIRN